MKGESNIDLQETFEAGHAEANDALSKQQIPREMKKQLKEYVEQVGGQDKK